MNKSDLDTLDTIELPDAPGFISKPPRYELEEMITLCEKLLPYWNQQRYSKPEPPFIGEEFTCE